MNHWPAITLYILVLSLDYFLLELLLTFPHFLLYLYFPIIAVIVWALLLK